MTLIETGMPSVEAATSRLATVRSCFQKSLVLTSAMLAEIERAAR